MTKIDISDLLNTDRTIPIYYPKVEFGNLKFSLPNPGYSIESDFRDNQTLELYVGISNNDLRQVLYPTSISIPKGTKRVLYKGNKISNYELSYVCDIKSGRKEGGYTASFPDLPGVATQGESLEEIREMARDASLVWLRSMFHKTGRSELPEQKYKVKEKKLDKNKYAKITFKIAEILPR